MVRERMPVIEALPLVAVVHDREPGAGDSPYDLNMHAGSFIAPMVVVLTASACSS